jgi:hypothetical protein
MRPALLPLLFLAASPAIAQQPNDRAQELAREVWRASGGENWQNVQQIRFTFVVADQEKELARVQHEWDLVAGTDRVRWRDKEGNEKTATVNLANPPADGDGKAAYARWVNDSYWLLAPLKVLDPGVKLSQEGTKELNGVEHELLRLSFEQVGLTPNDQYVLYIHPETKLVSAWDYIPNEEKVMHSTWEDYQQFGGLKLATLHQFNGRTIRFEDVAVQMRD